MSRTILTAEQKQSVIKIYQNKPITIAKIAQQFNVSNPTMGKILKGIPRWTKTELANPNANLRWFQHIDNQNKAYFLGLFIADGNIHISDKSPNCNITLSTKDEYILQKWFDLVGMNKKISHDGRGCSQAAILSQSMADDLAQYGVVPQKTKKTFLPIIDDDLMPHLIRGIIDGDGNITAKWHKSNDGRNRFLHKIAICGTHKLMDGILTYLSQHLKLQTIPTIYNYQSKTLSEIHFSNYNDIILIGNWIYNNAETYLVRKKDNFDLIVQRTKEMKIVC